MIRIQSNPFVKILICQELTNKILIIQAGVLNQSHRNLKITIQFSYDFKNAYQEFNLGQEVKMLLELFTPAKHMLLI